MNLADVPALPDVELAAFSAAEAKKALKLYRVTRGELRDRLDSLPAGTFTAQHYRNALAQVTQAILGMENTMSGDLRGSLTGTAKLSFEHLKRQAEAFGAQFEDTIRPTPLRLAAAIDQGKTMLLPQFDSSVRRYGHRLIDDIRARLAVSMASHEPVEQMKKRIFNEYLLPLGTVRAPGGKGEVPVTAHWAERLVRTEVSQAYNTMHLTQLAEQADEEPELLKCWSATMERRT